METINPKQLNDIGNYDTENYDGQVVCEKCRSLLYVKLLKGKVQKYKIIKKEFSQSEPIKYVEIVKDYGEGQSPQTRMSEKWVQC